MPFPQPVQALRRRSARHFDHVGLGHVRRSFHQKIGEFAVVGQQQQAFAGVIQATDGVDAGPDPVQQVHHRGAMFGIFQRGDVSLGLVHQQVDMPLRAVQQLSVDANVVVLGVGLAAQFRDHLPVDRHQSAGDQLLCLAAGGDAGGGDDFLQAFSGHEDSGKDSCYLDALRGSSRGIILARLNCCQRVIFGAVIRRWRARFGDLLHRQQDRLEKIRPPASRILPCWAVRRHRSSQSAGEIPWSSCRESAGR